MYTMNLYQIRSEEYFKPSVLWITEPIKFGKSLFSMYNSRPVKEKNAAWKSKYSGKCGSYLFKINYVK